MKTEIFKIDPKNIDTDVLKYCAECLRTGGLVCFPTETVYGLGANAFMQGSVSKIFKAKGRPSDNPLIVHISDYEMLDLVTDCGDIQREMLMKIGEKYWPGPLTMIVSRDDAIPETVSCGLSTVGIRYPENPIAKELIRLAGVPVAAPSANISGRPSPSEAAHVIEDLNGKVDIIIDGGPCKVGVESTVLDLTSGKPTILRPGAVTLEQISAVYDAEAFDWRVAHTGGDDCDIEKPKSPGMKYTHYSPNAEVIIYDGTRENIVRKIKSDYQEYISSGKSAGIMTVDENLNCYVGFSNVISLGGLNEPLYQAATLFSSLRKFDELGAEKVFAEAVPGGGVGDAVMNRLYRAAGGNMINCDKI
ncbi:MAG: threonylcarbamoyl-AMP synthase [Ruminococcaceae bacterium]|nr:threonylcarbamoyl-AMP synthase [Oscillospiraceae bacterium]